MCDIEDVQKAYKILKKTKLTIMQCHSVYPLKTIDANINVIKLYKKNLKIQILDFLIIPQVTSQQLQQ